MNSLKIKFLTLTCLILVMAIGLTAWHNLRTQRAILSQSASQNARILGDTVRSSIITNMASGQNSEVAAILERVRREPTIESIYIFDETGRILMSAEAEEIGDLAPASDLIAYREGRTFYSDRHDGLDLYNALVPIANAPNCHDCHDPEQQVLGILGVHLSQTATDALLKQGREATLLSSIGMLTILILAITVFLLYYVDAPIRRLVDGMTHVEKGDFDQPPIEVRTSKEMALVASKFNLMILRLKDLLATKVEHERQMAVAHEKLAHHDEIRNMNAMLEERLRENQFLNITLEERIEEIEEANYKIADLASDLEAKNTTLAQTVARLSALYKMGLVINSTMDLDELFDLLLRKAVEALGAQTGYILLLDREKWSLRIGAAMGIPEDLDREMRIPLRPGGVSHWVIEKQQPLLIRNINETREFSRISRLGFTRETVICAPLVIKEEVIGTLTMANRRDGSSFSGEDLDLLSTIAAQASIAINNARLYEEQEITYLSTVQALVSTIEANDSYTRGHSERVTRYSMALARQLGLPPESIRRLEQAAILHDIGKIGIDSSLLHKAEELSAGDIDLLRQHPLIGVRILEPIRFLRDVRAIIEQHHERFDGRGYPHGLAGEDLLLEARILAVADAYDAMTSDRPYRKSISHEATVREIAANSGTQFDPHVVEAFLSLWESGQLRGEGGRA